MTGPGRKAYDPIIRGQIVFSKCGRDKGLPMVVLDVDGEYLYLVDGNSRTIERPKKKKAKHVQPTHHIAETVPICGRALQDADIRKQLRVFREGGKPPCQKTM